MRESHYINMPVFPTNVIAIFITSIGTALVVLKTNSIISGFLIHILNNGMSFRFFAFYILMNIQISSVKIQIMFMPNHC